MTATSVPTTVAMTTIVTTPTAMPIRGRSIVRQTARRSARDRDGEVSVTSAIEGGLASGALGARGPAPLSSAKNTNAGLGSASPSVGRAGPESPGSTAASSSAVPGPAGAAAGAIGADATGEAIAAGSTDHE